jgi:hypothetical protein
MSTWYVPNGPNGSMTVNGQIIPSPMGPQFFPELASAPFYRGNGQPPPTVPLNFVSSATMSDQAANMAASDPFNFTQSPVIIAVAALVLGILGLRYIHWRG